MENIKFSIIIPVYNVEKYIDECINSVLTQTYQNIEIILVNDGSTDESGEICEAYNDGKRVKVIHKNNSGLSDARNVGIDNATGDYIAFLDSDDYWNDKEFLYNLNQIILSKKVDLVEFGVCKYFEKSGAISCRNYSGFQNVNIETLIKENIFKACAWDKIVKKSVIDSMSIRFKSGYYSEDIDWCSKLLIYCKEIYFYNKPVYIYRQRENSITSNVKYKHIMDILELCKVNMESMNLCDDDKELVYNYLAYEYSVALGLIGAFKGKEKKELIDYTKKLDILLKYKVNKKVKCTRYLMSAIGKKNAVFVLGSFIKIKRLKRI